MFNTPITAAYGDGIGPEIMTATLQILSAAGASLEIETVEIGEKVYLKGHPTGIEPHTWDSIRRTKVLLKAPMTTPQGGGYKSLNVSIRTRLGLYANVRPCVSYAPFIATKCPQMDLVIIRENEEDLYTGIEYRQTPDACQALKLISRPGSEKIIRYAFEYAKLQGRKRVTCFTKDNIMKFSDGLFHKIFEEIASEYPSIAHEHWIVDIGAAKMAATPEAFDVIVLPNLYGDVLSDVAAQIAGSVGLAGSANIGSSGAMFEAIHGSAPRRAGQNAANPSGLILAAVMMLVHIGQHDVAARVHNAWLKTIEEGIHTYDIFKEGTSKQKVGTKEFAEAVIRYLGKNPSTLKSVVYEPAAKQETLSTTQTHAAIKRELVGVDVFIYWQSDVASLTKQLLPIAHQNLELEMIANRGAQVWPEGVPETCCIDQWRCRYKSKQKNVLVTQEQIIQFLQKLADAKFDFFKTEFLYNYGDEKGYS